MAEEKETETKIFEAAERVFHRRGFHGARMQEIADEAGINKALLHYYYRSKEKLFEVIFRAAARQMFPRIARTFNADLPIEEKVRLLIATYLDFLSANPHLPGFVLHEMSRHPEHLKRMISSLGAIELDKLGTQIDARVAAGTMRPIAPEQFVVNLVALCAFPFVARPMIHAVLGLDDDRFAAFIEARKRELPTFFLNALRP